MSNLHEKEKVKHWMIRNYVHMDIKEQNPTKDNNLNPENSSEQSVSEEKP